MAIAALAAMAIAGSLVVPPRPAAANPLFPADCMQVGGPVLVSSWTQHSPRGTTYVISGEPDDVESTETLTNTWTGSLEVSVSATFGLEADAVIAQAKGEISVSAKRTETISTSHSLTVTVPRGKTLKVSYGFYVGHLKYRRTFSPAGCNRDAYHSLFPWYKDETVATVPIGQGWHKQYWPGGQGSVRPPNPGAVDPPSPQPQPVTSVYGLADGTVLHTTDTRRIYKMVGGAPVWQATCADGICLPASRPTTQAVIDAGPDVPRNGSSAIDQRGRVYIFVGGAPLWQSHCSAPVHCGTPVKVSDWSIDARDHMNQVPADRQLLQGWTGGTATPVAQTVGGARVNFANERELLDTGFGAGWRSNVVIVSTASFNALGVVPRDGTLLQGTAGGASTPVAMFAGGARINFASGREVEETGYGSNWASKVRAIPKRAFDALRADVPPDGTLVQGIANGVATPVAMMVGGTRINFANADEVVASGYGTDWRKHVRTIPTRAFNMISDGPPVDGTLIQGAGGAPTPVAEVLGGGRMNFANAQEVIDAGHGADWRQKVRSIPVRAYNAIYEGIGHGVRVRKAGTQAQAGILGGARLPFASMTELRASTFADRPMWTVPARIWDGLPTRIPDAIRLRAAETGTLFRVHRGEADLMGQCPAASGCDGVVTVSQSMIDRIAHGVANRGPAYGVLGRYFNGTDHYTTTGGVPAGYRLEYAFGQPARTAEDGTVPLYACRLGADTFLSRSSTCEGNTVIGRLGWLYTAPPPDRPAQLLYRCLTEKNEHFTSISSTCEGKRVEFPLGYVIAYAPFTRYFDGTDHRSAVAGVPAGHQPEHTFGMLPLVSRPGTLPLYACKNGSDTFLARDENCEGKETVTRLGWIYTSPPAGVPSIELFRCLTASGEHFSSTSAQCEGRTTERSMGYLVARTVLSRAMRGSDHRTGIGVFPAGYRHEHSFGLLAATEEPGTRALYACRAGSDTFTSHSATCENQTVIRRLGWIWQQPPPGTRSVRLFRCMVNGTTEHFDTISETCEGHRLEFPLGYLRLES